LKKNQKPKKFLNRPEFPGGKKAFNEYIKNNLRYPDEALAAGIEGDVLVVYDVNDNGKILNARIKHGIGYGCDEEALRLVEGLQFAGVTNRGVRVKTSFTTRIPFRKPMAQRTTSISYKPAEKKVEKPAETKGTSRTYTWQIPVNNNENQQ